VNPNRRPVGVPRLSTCVTGTHGRTANLWMRSIHKFATSPDFCGFAAKIRHYDREKANAFALEIFRDIWKFSLLNMNF
jgi:hypothetical protein